jgi:hypothetical protein
MSAQVIDVSGLPEPVVTHIRQLVASLREQLVAPSAGHGSGVLDFLDALPAAAKSDRDWADFEREFQAERDSWER